MEQVPLFDLPGPPPAGTPGVAPVGLVHDDDFLSGAEEAALIDLVREMPLVEATYRGYTARRRIVSYGSRFDFATNTLHAAPPLVAPLQPLRGRVARWAGMAPEALAHTLVSEYRPGTPLGWHRDVPDYEEVFGISLGGPAVLLLRPFTRGPHRRADVVRLPLAPRSIYRLRGPARWDWQHSVRPVPALRWSITFRTRRGAGSPA